MNWPHAPSHWKLEPGIFMVTAGTYNKSHHLTTDSKRDSFQSSLFTLAQEFGWQLHAWAILSNHYHLIARSPTEPNNLKRMIGKLHMSSAKQLNIEEDQPGRKVWFQYWDSHITFQPSYFARLRYVHTNPVHHGVVSNAENYPWCSAAWFTRSAPAALVRTIGNMKTDRVNVPDDF